MVRFFLLLLTLAVASGCGTTKPASPTGHGANEIESSLRRTVSEWEDTPYRFGGSTRAGADCSGFVMRVYDDVFGIELPRTTRQQVHVGRSLSRSQLRAGDLVLFRTGNTTRHVGIYLSDGEFAHVSTTDGVTVSSLELPYWQESYWTSRRILSPQPAEQPAAAQSPPDPPPTTPTQSPVRGGW